jgi:hypothetical protein
MALLCVVLAAVVVHSLFETPNTTGGGTVIMFGIIFLAVAFRAAIMFCLSRWDKRIKRHDDAP